MTMNAKEIIRGERQAMRRAIRAMGGPENISQRINAYSELVREMSARKADLTEQHPNQWAALYRDGGGYQVLTAESLEALLRKSDTRGLDRSSIAVEFLSNKKQTFIL